jgi:hypothetical protein
MNESLLSPSNIILFGRLFPLYWVEVKERKIEGDAELDDPKREKGLGSNRFLRDQLRAPGARLARIYSFSYEGTFYNLPKPAIYLVHGDGTPIREFAPIAAGKASVSASGVAARDFGFELDLRFWEYDKSDYTLRCDIASGTFDEVLLDAALSMTARDALVSRSDLAARSDLASRSDLAARSDLASRSDLAMRHRIKG